MSDVKNSSLATDLVSYWELEEASGTRVDSHGSNDLTDVNTVGQAAGIQGDGADFENTNTEYLTITDASQTGLGLSGSLSISCWVKFESTPSSGAGFGIVTKDNLTTASAYFLSVFNSSGTLYLYNQVNRTTSIIVQNFASWAPSTGVWYHLVLTFNASTGALICYVNGSSYVTNTNASVTSVQNNSLNFSIGAHHTGTRPFDGVIDEVGIWSRALSASDVTTLYNSGSGIPYDAGSAPAVNNGFMLWW